MTHDDILHEEILKKGQNKYSTLKKVTFNFYLLFDFLILSVDQSRFYRSKNFIL